MQELDKASPLEARRFQWKRGDPERKMEFWCLKVGEVADGYRTQ